ncbi:hypothetical protein D3C76_753430 [compost metagenome]
MAALGYLTEQGFVAKRNGMRVRVYPASKLTDDVRQYVKAHRRELLVELEAGDGHERRCHWSVTRNGRPLCVMIGEPMTRTEALENARWCWPGLELK